MTVGGNIKNLRTEQNLTQDQLGEKLYVTRQTISNWERGISRPDLEQLEAIAAALGTDVMTLIYGPKPGFRPARHRVLLGGGLVLLAVFLGLLGTLRLAGLLTPMVQRGYFGMWSLYRGLYLPIVVLLGVVGAILLAESLSPLVPGERLRRGCLIIGILFALCWLVPLAGLLGAVCGGETLAGGWNFILLTRNIYWLPLAVSGIFLTLALLRPPKKPDEPGC